MNVSNRGLFEFDQILNLLLSVLLHRPHQHRKHRCLQRIIECIKGLTGMLLRHLSRASARKPGLPSLAPWTPQLPGRNILHALPYALGLLRAQELSGEMCSSGGSSPDASTAGISCQHDILNRHAETPRIKTIQFRYIRRPLAAFWNIESHCAYALRAEEPHRLPGLLARPRILLMRKLDK